MCGAAPEHFWISTSSMEPTGLADVFKVLIDRADLTLEEARNTAHACKENLAVFRAEGDSLLEHLPLYRHVPRGPPRSKSLCRTGCGRSTLRIFELYPHAGPLCMNVREIAPGIPYDRSYNRQAALLSLRERSGGSAHDSEVPGTCEVQVLQACRSAGGGTQTAWRGGRITSETRTGSQAEGGGPEGRREAQQTTRGTICMGGDRDDEWNGIAQVAGRCSFQKRYNVSISGR